MRLYLRNRSSLRNSFAWLQPSSSVNIRKKHHKKILFHSHSKRHERVSRSAVYANQHTSSDGTSKTETKIPSQLVSVEHSNKAVRSAIFFVTWNSLNTSTYLFLDNISVPCGEEVTFLRIDLHEVSTNQDFMNKKKELMCGKTCAVYYNKSFDMFCNRAQRAIQL